MRMWVSTPPRSTNYMGISGTRNIVFHLLPTVLCFCDLGRSQMLLNGHLLIGFWAEVIVRFCMATNLQPAFSWCDHQITPIGGFLARSMTKLRGEACMAPCVHPARH